MINEYEYEELLKDIDVQKVLGRLMTPEQLKFEFHEAQLESARQSMIGNIDALWRKIYNNTMAGEYQLSFPCGKNKVLYEKLKYTLNELGYKVSRNDVNNPEFYELHIEW